MDADALRAVLAREGLVGAQRPVTLHCSSVTGSTQDDAADLAADRLPAVLVTAHQTAGRGRGERRWEDTPGGSVLMSVAWPLRAPLTDSWTALGCGARIVERLRRDTGVPWLLKWPNDIVRVRAGDGLVRVRAGDGLVRVRAGDGSVTVAKAGGVLLTVLPDRVILGCGLNLTVPAGAGRTSVAAERGPVTPQQRTALVGAIAAESLRGLAAHVGADVPPGLALRVARVLIQPGCRVRVSLPSGAEISGVTQGLGADGALLVALAGGDQPGGDQVVAVRAGSVVYVSDVTP